MKNLVNQIVFVSGIMIIMLLTGCGDGSSISPTSTSNPGELCLSKLNGMVNSADPIIEKTINPYATDTTTFDLGTIKASQEFYFLLSNTGDFPVTNVTIATDNANFTVSPSTIDGVPPQGSGFILPIIKVSVTHGVALNGIGYTDSLLPMGHNNCILTITGETTDSSNKAISLKYKIKLNIFAQVFDIQLSDGIIPIDLLSPTLTILGIKGASGAVSNYYCTIPKIRNTGNVDIDITNHKLDAINDNPIIEQFTLHPDEERELLYPIGDYNNNRQIYIYIESGNTITNYKKMKIEPDGSVYLAITTYQP